MCGIFGAIGQYSPNDLKILAILNEVRGTDSCGFYNGTLVKSVRKPRDMIADCDLLNVRTSRFIIGHTRKATVGAVSLENAHPFQEEHITGVHNGSVENFEALKDHFKVSRMVDSEIIFWGLNKFGTDWLKEINSFYSLAWVDDREPEKLWLACSAKPLAITLTKRAIWFSSDGNDLRRMGWEPKEVASDTLLEIDINKLTIKTTNVGPVRDCYSKYKKEKEVETDLHSDRGFSSGMWKPKKEEKKCVTLVPVPKQLN